MLTLYVIQKNVVLTHMANYVGPVPRKDDWVETINARTGVAGRTRVTSVVWVFGAHSSVTVELE